MCHHDHCWSKALLKWMEKGIIKITAICSQGVNCMHITRVENMPYILANQHNCTCWTFCDCFTEGEEPICRGNTVDCNQWPKLSSRILGECS